MSVLEEVLDNEKEDKKIQRRNQPDKLKLMGKNLKESQFRKKLEHKPKILPTIIVNCFILFIIIIFILLFLVFGT